MKRERNPAPASGPGLEESALADVPSERAQTGADLLARPVEGVERFGPGVNLVWSYGQSNMLGPHAWPPLWTAPQAGNYVLGDDVQPQGAFGRYVPLGGAWLTPLQGKVVTRSKTALTDGARIGPDVILSAEQIGRLEPGTGVRGESPDVAAAAVLRPLARRSGITDDALLVLGNGAEGAQPIAALAKGAEPDIYGRFPSWLSQVSALAAGKPVRLLAILWMQGEADYPRPPNNTRAAYKAALQRLYADLLTDSGGAPAIFLGVPGGVFTRDVDGAGAPDLAIASGIMEFCRETPGAFCVGPYAQYEQSVLDGHLSAWGSTCFGVKAAQAMARVLCDRCAWEPLQPLAVRTAGLDTTLELLAPAPPTRAARAVPDCGFRGQDGSGAIPIESVAQIDETTWRITWTRAPGADAVIFYASARSGGVGAICDSDELLLPDGACLPLPPGRSLDTANWLVPFCLPMNWTRPGL